MNLKKTIDGHETHGKTRKGFKAQRFWVQGSKVTNV
jgi:hypothetical protein